MNVLDITPEVKNYDAWKLQPLEGFATVETFLRHLIGWAVLAPSTHNTQPWKFMVEPHNSSVFFCLDPHWILPASDKEGRQAMISMGCALQNFLRAADYYGVPCEVTYPLAREGHPEPFITVRVGELSARIGYDSRLLDMMRERRMNRKRFDPKRKISLEIIEEIKKIADNLGLTVDIVNDWITKNILAETQYKADQVVLAMDEFRNELGRFFLPNNTTEERGMPGSTFGLDDEMSEKIHDELLKEGAFDAYIAEAFPAGDREAFKSASLILVISIPEDTSYFRVIAGRALESIALLAQENNLGFSVHAAMTEVTFLRAALKVRLMRSGDPAVICRLGYPLPDATIPPHSPRVSEELIEVKNQKMEGE